MIHDALGSSAKGNCSVSFEFEFKCWNIMQRLVNNVCIMVLSLECQYCSEFIRDHGLSDGVYGTLILLHGKKNKNNVSMEYNMKLELN